MTRDAHKLEYPDGEEAVEPPMFSEEYNRRIGWNGKYHQYH